MSNPLSVRESAKRPRALPRRRLAPALAAFGAALLASACATGEPRTGAAAGVGGLVTVAEWNLCAREGACPFHIDDSARATATEVSWDDAQLYLRWLSAREGGPRRLPRLAEWTPRGGDLGEWLDDCHPVSDAPPGAPCSHRLIRPVMDDGPEALSPSLRLTDVGFRVVPAGAGQ